jgi:hypothetical protein
MEASVDETRTVSPPSTPGSEATPLRAPAIPVGVPLLLSLPAWIPLIWVAARAWLHGQVPTAFIAYDLAYYVANGRQHFEQGFHLLYNNPYASYGTPAIYFQPHLFLLGVLQWIGLSPDASLILFGVPAVAFASIVAAKLYQEWVGWRTTAQKLGFVCFFWGGGVLSLTGAVFGLLGHTSLTKAFFLFDPSQGWWMLNFGRNLVYPTEAFYHGLFLLTILFLIRKQFGWTLAAAGVLAASHPFAGLSLAIILTAYAALELALASGAASWRLLAGSVTITALQAGYYVVFLNRFADHRAVETQWQLDWPYLFWTFVPALYLVGILALGRLTRWKNLAPLLAQPRMRLCLVWFAVIFGLTQHDLVIRPRQPIHFAHGYDWIALFLLATPALFTMIEKLLAIRWTALRALALAGFLAVFLSDNLLWFASFADAAVQNGAIPITRDDQDVFHWLDGHAAAPSYVVSSSRWINYLTPTYTHVRSWSGHDYNTPHAAERFAQTAEAFSAGKPIPTANPVYYIPARDLHWTPPLGSRSVYSNGTYEVWLYDGSK